MPKTPLQTRFDQRELVRTKLGVDKLTRGKYNDFNIFEVNDEKHKA